MKVKRTHLIPILSSRCEGFSCRACPRPWRFFVTGMELWGMGDNATFFLDATEDYRRKPTEKLTRARWRRVLLRWISIAIPFTLSALWGLATVVRRLWEFFHGDPPTWSTLPWGWMLLAYIGIAVIGSAIIGGQAFAAWWAVREVRSTYIIPAAKVLARVSGVGMKRRDMLSAIELPESFGQEVEGEPEPVRVYMPEVVLDEGSKKRIANAVGARLGLPDPIAKWTESGVPVRYCELYPAAVPPKRVNIDDLLEELLAGDMDHPLVGVMTNGRVSRMDFVNDSPHSLGSAGSGGGKSTLYKLIAIQRLRLGGYGIFLDFKKWSHLRWAGRLPGGRVLIEDEVPQIHNALCKILDELIWRKRFDLKDEAKLARLPVIDVYVEEINTLMDLLIEYWGMERARQKQEARTNLRRIKETAKESDDPTFFADQIEEAEEELARANGLPVKSPAVQAIKYGVNLGREFRIHFHFIGQSIDAKAAGGRNTRESFKTRLLARWDLKTWKMLADGIPFITCPSGDVGIWAHVHAGTCEIVRVPYVPDEWAVNFVLGGARPSLPMFHGDPIPSIEEEAIPSIETAAPLSKIVDMLPLKVDGDRMTLDALRTASKRDGFPSPVGEAARGAKLYLPDEVMAWFRDREGPPMLGA